MKAAYDLGALDECEQWFAKELPTNPPELGFSLLIDHFLHVGLVKEATDLLQKHPGLLEEKEEIAVLFAEFHLRRKSHDDLIKAREYLLPYASGKGELLETYHLYAQICRDLGEMQQANMTQTILDETRTDFRD